MQTDPAWKDNLYEYFHGDNGAGLGAMHQTGWTALVADLLLDPPRRVRRMIFYDDDDDPDVSTIAQAQPANQESGSGAMPPDLSKITHPFFYEINTWPWLEAISRNEEAAIDLDRFPIVIGMK